MPKLTPQQRERNESMHNWLDQYMVKHPPPYTKHEKMLIRDVLMAKFGGGRKQTLSLLSRKIDRFGKSRKARTPTVLTAQNLEIAVRFMSKKNMNSAELLRAMWRDNRNLKMSDTSARSLHKLALPLATQRRHEISLRRAATRQKFLLLLGRVTRFYRKVRLFTEHSKFRIEKQQLLIISRRRERSLWVCGRIIHCIMVRYKTITWWGHLRELYGYGTRAMMLFRPCAGDLRKFWLWRTYVVFTERSAIESREKLNYLEQRAERQNMLNTMGRAIAEKALAAAAQHAQSKDARLQLNPNQVVFLNQMRGMVQPETTPEQWSRARKWSRRELGLPPAETSESTQGSQVKSNSNLPCKRRRARRSARLAKGHFKKFY